MAALQATLSLLLVLSAYFASEENTNVIFFSGTILNISIVQIMALKLAI